jgi:hypothetical protein
MKIAKTAQHTLVPMTPSHVEPVVIQFSEEDESHEHPHAEFHEIEVLDSPVEFEEEMGEDSVEFSEEDLYRLDQEVKQHYPKNTCYKSTCRIKRSESYARRIRDQENSILSLETRMDEIKTVLINAIQNDYFSWQIGEIVIDNNRYDSINQFIYYTVDELRLLFINLKVYDLDRAIHYNKTIIEELKLVENCSLTNATKIINLVKTY